MKYGPEITKEICDYFRQGSNRTDACQLVGIHYETFTIWMQKPEFSDSVKTAEASCKQRNIALIQKAAITTWQAAAWWLERKYSDEFALKTRLEHSGSIEEGRRPSRVDLEIALKQLRDFVPGNGVVKEK